MQDKRMNKTLYAVISLVIIFLLQENIILAADQCITINNIAINHTNKYIARKTNKITQEYIGTCMNIDDIKNVIRKVTNLYIDLGYITTRVALPEQDLSSGTLILNIVEGYIEAIDIDNKHKLIPPFIPLKANKTLSLRDIEQTYDHYSKVSSNDVNILIKPGKKPGGSLIFIENKPKKKWRVKTGIDNSGSKHKGELLSYTNLTIEDLLGHNETYIFNVKQSLDDKDIKYTNSKTLSFSFPFEYSDLNYSYNYSKNKSYIENHGKKYKNSGDSTVYKVDLSRILHRDSKSKTSISLGYGHELYSNYFDKTKIQISSYKLKKMDLGLSFQSRLDASVLAMGLNLTSGINKGDFSKFGVLSVPERNFNKININASWFKPTPVIIAKRNIQFRSQLSAQYTPHMLASSEKFSLGGLSSIRGFKEMRENADNAFQLRNELIAFLPTKDSKLFQKFFGEFSIFIAFDIGHFSNYEERGKEKRGTLAGVATGIRNSNGIFDIDITISRPTQTITHYKHKNIVYFSFGINV